MYQVEHAHVDADRDGNDSGPMHTQTNMRRARHAVVQIFP
jgi:hypothetical protein